MKRVLFILIPACLVILLACEKEHSIETGGNNAGLAVGSLLDSSGNCKAASVKGTYRENQTLADSNYVDVKVTVVTPGQYKITTDTMNGFSFKDSGFFSTTGSVTVRLKGKGKPIIPVTTQFTVAFSGSFCSFSVPVATGTTPPPTVNNADTAWMFNDAMKHYQGHVDSATVRLVGAIGFLRIYGKPITNDTTIYISLQLGSPTAPPSGTYTTTGGTAVFEFKTPAGNTIYDSRQGDGSNLIFTVTGFDTVTKVMDATFTGTAKDATGNTKTITSGKLKVQVQ
jgi:hypothetical protein